MSATEFWTENQVGGPYVTLAGSVDALMERERLYPNLYDMMPVTFPNQTVLDYGCGPGHDTILFCEHGAGHVFYYDVSPLALDIVDARLALHGLENHASPVERSKIPHVDHVHCAGVLHHTANPKEILRGLHWALKRGGEARVMIYDGDRSPHTESKVPITHWWTEEQFVKMAYQTGWDAEYQGSYECSSPWRPDCFAACYRMEHL